MKYFLSIFLLPVLLYCNNDLRAANRPMIDTAKHQHKKHLTTFEEYKRRWEKHPASYDDCVFNNMFSLQQRLAKYPFSKANKIVAVSYQCCESPRDVLIDDTIARQPDTVFQSGLHVEGGKLNYSSLKEIKTLDQHQISRLTNLIYNTAHRKNASRMPYLGPSCYNPRNALLFYNKEGKIYDYLEVCFECEKISSLSKRITVGTDCTQKLDLFKKFLVDAGIKYGTLQTD
jgi:hypothetical protein